MRLARALAETFMESSRSPPWLSPIRQAMPLAHRGLAIFALGFLAGLSGCAPPAGSGATCKAADGSVVDPYEIFGQWKKISGYTTPRSATQLKLDFDLLIVKKGDLFCSLSVKNGGIQGWNYLGNYTHDIPSKKLDWELVTANSDFELPGLTPDTSITGVGYSFTGSCSDVQMKLRVPGAGSGGVDLIETYELYNKTYEDTDCVPE